jgi:hypothetical protein
MLLFIIFLGGLRLSPFGTVATIGLLAYDGDCGAIGGMKMGKGDRSTRRNPDLVPLCSPQNPT